MNRIQPTLVALSCLAACNISLKAATPPDFEWVRELPVAVRDIATDTDGNVYATGNFKGAVSLDGVALHADDATDVFVAKFDPTGTALWAKSGGATTSLEVGEGVVVDRLGHCYVTGMFSTTATFDTHTVLGGAEAGFLVKYGSDGSVVWARNAETGWPKAVTLDPDMNPVLCRGLVVKFSPDGGRLWATGTGGAVGVASDEAGNSYVVGSSGGAPSEIIVSKYSPDGSRLWSKDLGGRNQSNTLIHDGSAVASDGLGNIYFTGRYETKGVFDHITLDSRGKWDIFLAKCDAAGNLLWVKGAGGSWWDEQGLDVASDAGDGCYCVGRFHETAYFDTVSVVSSPGTGDGFVAKYGADGAVKWVQRIGGGAARSESVDCIARDSGGNCFVAGKFAGTASFGSKTLTTASATGASFLARLQNRRAQITVPPQSQTVVAGGSASFAVEVNSTLPVAYRWRKDGAELPGQTGRVLTLNNVTLADEGEYVAVAENADGSVRSTAARLTVEYSLNTPLVGTGTVTRLPEQQNFLPGAVVTLTAQAPEGWAFLEWREDATGSQNPLPVTMDSNKSVTGVFVSTALAVTVEGDGLVSRQPDKPFYSLGEQVLLTATQGRWHAFTGWDDGNTANPRTIAIGADNSYVATFTPTEPLETLEFGGVTRLAPVGMPAIFVQGRFIVDGPAYHRGAAEVAIQTSFPRGTILYTLDGTDPAFGSRLYSAPFRQPKSATLRAVAYNESFTAAVESDPIELVILPTLTTVEGGGGSIVVEPPEGAYGPGGTVTVTAVPAPGWQLLHWLGDVEGSGASATLTMNRDKCVEAVFGTALSVAAIGSGTVQRIPDSPLYPWGAVVRLVGLPAAGNYLAFWGTAPSSTVNPLEYHLREPNVTVNGVFAALPANQRSLVVVPAGFGSVTVDPPANAYAAGAHVILTVTPEADQLFTGWDDTANVTTPLSMTMDESRVVTAHFTETPRLDVSSCLAGYRDGSLRMLVTGAYGATYRIEGSFDMREWGPVGTVTTTCGRAQVQDLREMVAPYQFYRAVSVP